MAPDHLSLFFVSFSGQRNYWKISPDTKYERELCIHLTDNVIDNKPCECENCLNTFVGPTKCRLPHDKSGLQSLLLEIEQTNGTGSEYSGIQKWGRNNVVL